MKLPALSYRELSIRSKTSSESEKSRLADFFETCGAARQEIVLAEIPNAVQAMVYTKSETFARKVENLYARERQKGWNLKSRILKQHEWYDKWHLEYQIMPLGKKFLLVPEWEKDDYQKMKKGQGARERGRIPLYLDPMGASGSGEHPTTQIMVEFIESLGGKYSDCLDLGAGTGILAIAAAKFSDKEVSTLRHREEAKGRRGDLGPKSDCVASLAMTKKIKPPSWVAVDNDRMAIKSARFNFKGNGIKNFKVIHGDVLKSQKRKQYSLVCANLISPVLETIQKQLFSSVCKNGYLLVSGIHIQNFPAFKKKFRHPQFRCLRVRQRRGWTGLLLKRIQ